MKGQKYLENSQISLSDESIKFWANKLNCSEKDLRDSISKIGNNLNVLSMYLEMNHLMKK
jgi:hypothetical protein